MANQRAAGQTMVGFWADEAFTAKIDAARKSTPRSQWLRDVIAGYLLSEGFKVSTLEKSAPDRKGKGGPKIFISHSSSDQKTPEEKFVDAVEAEADRQLAQAAARKRSKLSPRRIVSRRPKKPTAL